MISKEKYINLFNDEVVKCNKKNQKITTETVIDFTYSILLRELERTKKSNKKSIKKKKKISLPVEKKIIKLITVYRRTTEEIKEIILKEHKIKISNRTIMEIKKKHNIKGYKIIKSET